MLEVKYNGDKIYSHIRNKDLVTTPEELVRQEFVCKLVNFYGYELAQMAEELKTKDGKGSCRADIVIWQTKEDKVKAKQPFIIVECKADNIRIGQRDYEQGESYARYTNAPFFITHNNHETRFWRIIKEKMPGYRQEITDIPKNNANDKEIEKLKNDLVVFKEDEFASLLHKCHNIIRDNDKLDPAAAFDEIAKILFMKVYVERVISKSGGTNVFNINYLEEQLAISKSSPLMAGRINSMSEYISSLFDETKKNFAKDQIFTQNEQINLKEPTIKKIISELEIYNLSKTSADIKGIAFERFLGRTFRGEIGQFFTPRSIVEFMIDAIDPLENEIICDPASGSGGFLIRSFSHIRELIQKDIIKQYEDYKKALLPNCGDEAFEIDNIPADIAKKLQDKYNELQKELQNDENSKGTRLFKLSNDCIFGTDANERMARTSKMNMIMHGDGHGGIHHHDGLLNINGIFENRFDIILTNPPFGSQVRAENLIEEKEAQTRFINENIVAKEGFEEYINEYCEKYGKETYQNAQRQILDNIGKPLASIFTLKPNLTSDKTEHLFINRALDLLKPGGRLGIVLPEGVFNTPNASYVRSFVEGRAFIRGIISLPNETFTSSKASVKCSILFAQKFTDNEQNEWNSKLDFHQKQQEKLHKIDIDNLEKIINYKKQKGQDALYTSEDKKAAKAKLKALQDEIKNQAWQDTKADFNYPIFMAQADNVGITSTGETGENVANELKDNGDEKGVATLFKEFLKEYKIAWNSSFTTFEGGEND